MSAPVKAIGSRAGEVRRSCSIFQTKPIFSSGINPDFALFWFHNPFLLNACTGSTGAGATAIAYRYKTRATSESTWSDWATATSTGVVTLGDLLGLTGFALQFTASDIRAAGSSATFRWAQILLTESVNTPIPAAVIAVTEPRYVGQAIPASVDAAT